MACGFSCSTACGIFPDRGLNLCPLHCRKILYHLSHQLYVMFYDSRRRCRSQNHKHMANVKIWWGWVLCVWMIVLSCVFSACQKYYIRFKEKKNTLYTPDATVLHIPKVSVVKKNFSSQDCAFLWVQVLKQFSQTTIQAHPGTTAPHQLSLRPGDVKGRQAPLALPLLLVTPSPGWALEAGEDTQTPVLPPTPRPLTARSALKFLETSDLLP